ncbi:hypothetical protein NQ314_008768 [Rhamnusium bicolor]|uniref:PEP5/VPS11 N-terminal domain-containing protein n=1 Tax=Rhamnusium bicolor TaxID=1586634 RepID=A0AAV8Y7Q7_9CUCU|nr:hypothetical protein NQ314_008768 [Rhamnusium bicolor]
MAFLEWRKFHFFDLKKNVDDGKIAELFKESHVTTTSNGNNHLILGDSLGQIYIISRSWYVTSFRGYEISVDFSYQLRNSPLLVTIGQDEPGINPLIKVWDTSRIDKNGMPYCYRITRAVPNNKVVQASALCKDKEQKFQLDNIGCKKKCSVLAESMQESHFMIGRNDVSAFLI